MEMLGMTGVIYAAFKHLRALVQKSINKILIMKKFIFIICLYAPFFAYSQPSPYGTGFTVGSKEDLEVRLAWAKKDPCFDPGFSKNSREALDLKKYRAIEAGANGKPAVCEKKK